MHARFSSSLTLAIVLAGFTGCSTGGGGTTSPASANCSGADANAICLQSCNLGCSTTRCEISEIAQNQNIVLVFTDNVDPLSVNSSTIRFRTASGEAPVGDFFVNGTVVEFQPQVLVVGGTSFFGFRAGETYSMTLPGGQGAVNAVRSTSGKPLKATITCSLNVTQGIVDQNGVPPSAVMVSPPTPPSGPIVEVPKDVVIQIRFNELIDVTPFQNANAGNGPVVFGVRRTRLVGTTRECDPTFEPVALSGSPRVDSVIVNGILVSVVSLRPTQLLPGNICVEVTVTDRVVDLAGKPAQPQVFQFQTVTEAQVEVEVPETFDDQAHFDRDGSSGEWGNGVFTFGAIGGDGRHGSFSVDYLDDHLGVVNGKRVFILNTDQTIIPGLNTLSGNPVSVSDGQFYFTDMVVPADVRLVFTGTHAPQFHVRGKLEVQGIIDLSGADNAYYLPATTVTAGQPGAAGAVFGGSGGRGGNKCLGTGFNANFNGQNGSDCSVLANHAYASSALGTGGTGSSLFPSTGLNSSIIFGPGVIAYVIQAAAGGGGGGLTIAGTDGRVVSNNLNDPVAGVPPRLDFMGPPAAGGHPMQLFPLPPGTLSSRHFIVGGSGGGGAGSQALFANNFITAWVPGCGGAGGGGAMALVAGDTLMVTANAQVLVRGGSAGRNESSISVGQPQSAPGGAGSGGSLLLQSGRLTDLPGLIDVRGGSGGYLNRQTTVQPPDGGRVVIAGGDGSPGFVRLEVPTNPLPALLPNVQPPPGPNNVGQLTEQDDRAGFMSKFYSTGQPIPPEFARYVIEARVNGNPVIYSDDPAVPGSIGPARFGQAPIQAYFQSVRFDLGSGEPDLTTLRPWRENVGFFNNSPGLSENGFRFSIVLDRTVGQTVEIDKVSIYYRN